MRIRTNVTPDQLRHAAQVAGVTLVDVQESGSRTHAHAYTVIISGTAPHGIGQQWHRVDGETPRAATWDEWGIFLAVIYAGDPTTRAGEYLDAIHFHWTTGNRFRNPARVVNQLGAKGHKRHAFRYTGHSIGGRYTVQECEHCPAIVRTVARGHSWTEIAS